MAVLGDVAKKNGLFTDGDWILSENMTGNGEIGVIQLKHVGIGRFLIKKDFQFISPQTFADLKCTEVLPGDILVSRMADPIARACIVPQLPFRTVTAVDVSIIRPDLSSYDNRYVAYLCNSNVVRHQAERISRGTTRNRITRTELEDITVALPELDIQRRIANMLDQCDRLRRLRRYATELSDSFLKSVFIEIFGDPVTNPKRWSLELFGEVGSLDRGKSKHRPRDAAHLYGGKYPFIQTGDVANCDDYLLAHKQTYSEEGLKQSKLWPPGVLCITIAANIAKTGILTYPACFPDSIVGFVPGESVRTEYVQYWLKFLQEILERTAPESAQKNINLEILEELKIPVPKLSLQDRFVEIVKTHRKSRGVQKESLRQVEHLFETLLQQAFSEN